MASPFLFQQRFWILVSVFLYGKLSYFSAEVLDSSFCLPIGKAKYEFQGGELDNLKQEVRKLLNTTPQEYPSVLLKLIDSMQRLGVAYHFEEEIKDAINLAQFDYLTANLYTTSLQFRLRRDRGCTIGSGSVFKFKIVFT
ncbi:hypothetical protein RHSIM_Rhsim06G0156200 [Rhododendron simsii]|uniref:Terpene synthase N-terminal domain-containing protein n=1 Tax=Rhododendron simsii TaxID=118357 RepID=A0A834GUV9_RHOSS|nr:hypothetical protein RHSIM_Rhsim06G0156200 [Rhododendron simsii]